MLLGRPLDAWISSCWTSFFWSSQWLQIFCKIVNLCTNYLANSLSDFSEIVPQNSEKCISAHPNFQNFPGEHAPGPPTGGEGRPSPWSRSDHKFWGLRIPRPPVTQILDPPLKYLVKTALSECYASQHVPGNFNHSGTKAIWGREWCDQTWVFTLRQAETVSQHCLQLHTLPKACLLSAFVPSFSPWWFEHSGMAWRLSHKCRASRLGITS